ncbi:hypothetical protein RA307_02340 [Xanthobacteraceae bacterium Astr-EGSB]|uniref:hypothetical protein n=1 Tax=Astrobacterium formosum TaxID=3069710 RepID=UPI0027B621E2|nr:hypothetical protein [Xanthobacteraceae bacterium Astr-EGSB]
MTKKPRVSNPTDRHAKAIAAAIGAGRPPVLTPALDEYLETNPLEIYTALEGVARHLGPAGQDAPLGFGYLFILQALLERLRFRIDRAYADATELVAAFQAELARRARMDEIDPHVLTYVGGALHQAGIAVIPELSQAVMGQMPDSDDEALPTDVGLIFREIFETCGGDPFLVTGALSEFGHTLPEEARASLIAGLPSGGPEGLAATVLFLLDPGPQVRRAAAAALANAAGALTPTDMRRLIAMRNWRPPGEREAVDAIVRKARKAGIACAPWDEAGVENIIASAIDGSAAQGFLLISPAGRKKRMSSILTKAGVADAWSGEPESSRRIATSLAEAGADAPMLVVSRAYLDRTVSHAMALGLDEGEVPPFGLLQVAEVIGGADWQPARVDDEEALRSLLAAIPAAQLKPAAVAAVLADSDALAGLDITQSWFEDGEDVTRMVAARPRGRGRAKLAEYLLQTVISRRRRYWADLFVRTALWMREAPATAPLCWRELAIIAKALVDGRDVAEISLMRMIAQSTITALRGRSRLEQEQ